jgi:hypothetical protein
MKAVKGALILIAFLAMVCVLPALAGGGYAFVKSQDPIEQGYKQEALRQTQRENERSNQLLEQSDSRWKPFWDELVLYTRWILPFGMLGLALFAIGSAGGFFIWNTGRAGVHLLNLVQFVKIGDMWVARQLALTTDVTTQAALKQLDWNGQARVEQAKNLAGSVDWSKVQNLRNLSLKAAPTSNRLPGPTVLPALPNQPQAQPQTAGDYTISQVTPEHKYELPFGVDRDGREIFQTLGSRFFNFLVAGTTRSGKTTLLQSQIEYLVNNHTPNELMLVLIDPKRRGFAPFRNDAHVLQYADTEPEWTQVLEVLDTERDRRQQVIRGPWQPGDRNPLIVVFIDELFDICHNNDNLDRLTRFTAKCLEPGIVVVGASQLPQSWLVPEALKANMAARACGYFPQHTNSVSVLGFSAANIPLGSYNFMTNFEGRGPMVRAPRSSYVQPNIVITKPEQSLLEAPKAVEAVETPEDKILRLVRSGNKKKSDLFAEFNNEITKEELDALLDKMKADGKVVGYTDSATGGRPAEMTALPGNEPAEKPKTTRRKKTEQPTE